jgi:class 3 adenylate cyclase/tetratricopeptide (TPR) repeat protein
MLSPAGNELGHMSKELEAWLTKFSLDQYAPVFHTNAIDMDVVTDLTDADLIGLGVAPLGHRKRLLIAIAALRQSRADTLHAEAIPIAGPQRAKAERRQVSVLFCDVVGSTEIAHRLDPEELGLVMDRYHRAAADTIRQMGGHVAQFLGDGVMAYFGWPTVHEDDAEHAVAVGLELVEALPRLSTPDGKSLAVRVGVATGLVVIGSEAGDGSIAMGETPNVAARLQAEAEPNTLVVSPLTARLAGRSFDYKSMGKRAIRGLPEPLELFQVAGRRSSLNRFKALRARSRAPLIGRSGEFELLFSRWQRATEREGQIVLMSGDAGIGKSRLVQATRERVGPDATVLRYQCSPLHHDTALFPVIQQLMRSMGIVGQQSTADKLAKVQDWLPSAYIDATEYLPLLCHLLGIKSPEHRLADASPQEIRERTMALLSQHFLALTNDGPVLAIVEDLHWVDPTSEELFVGILRNIERASVMVLATSRDILPQGWHVKGYTTDLHLDHLSDSESRRLIDAIAGDRLSEEVRAGIAVRAEGVPLYLEELTLALLEAGRSGEIGEVPTSLQTLLAARLDRMADTKPLLQLGAVLGRQFTLADLQAVAACSEVEVRAMVDKAVGYDLLLEAEQGNDSVLTFKHALVQDAAYESLLNSEKRRHHAAVLGHLEQNDQSAVAGSAVVLASHAERGEVWDKAAKYFVEALAQAVRALAYHEALALYDRTLGALKSAPAGTSTSLAIRARLLIFTVLGTLGQIDRGLEITREAEALARRAGDNRQLARAMSHLAYLLYMAGQFDAGLQSADEAYQLADELDDFSLRLSARFHQAILLQTKGALRQSCDLFMHVMDKLPAELETKRLGWAGPASVFARSYWAYSLVSLGEFEKARQTISRAIEQTHLVRDPISAGTAYVVQGYYHLAIGNSREAIKSFEVACRTSTHDSANMFLSSTFLGAAHTQAGRSTDALALLLAAEQKNMYVRHSFFGPLYFMALAQTHLAMGALSLAEAAIGQAEKRAEDSQALGLLADAIRIRANIAMRDPAATVGQVCALYQRAIDIARPCGMRPLIAQCLAGMAQAFEAAGDTAAAADYGDQARKLFDELGLPPDSPMRRQ